MRPVTVSIVSHGHGELLPGLLADLEACADVDRVILTRNVPEPNVSVLRPDWISVTDNARPQGFGANHNAAFRQTHTPFFAVLNPDVRFTGDPFGPLLACMQDGKSALCAPAVVNPSGSMEDSARRFPSIIDLGLKALGRYDGRLQYEPGDPPRAVPWVAGMFMLLRSADYAALGGFDEGFFLYYEDVDLCARLWKSGKRVMLCPNAQVVHDARRASRHDFRHMRWHAGGMARYLWKHAFRLRSVPQ